MLNLDTHIVVWLLTDQLTATERRILAGAPWGISSIVLWELSKLYMLGRTGIDPLGPEFTSALEEIHVWEISVEVAAMATRLNLRTDPADELIAATSIVHGVPLVTRDRRLVVSGIVPIARG